MIYLFEDRKDRMHHLLSKNIEDFNDIMDVNHVIQAGNPEEFDDYVSGLSDLKIFMLHKSYPLKKNLSLEEIKKNIKKRGHKLIIFSGGLNNAIVDEQELLLNSGTFYKNLPVFLEKYRESKEANIKYLLFGNANIYHKYQLKKFQNTALSKLITYFNQENTEVEAYVKTLKKIVRDMDLLKSKIFDESKEKLKKFLVERIEKNNYPKPETVFEQINKMVDSYEYL